jgi:hypothetical protein
LHYAQAAHGLLVIPRVAIRQRTFLFPQRLAAVHVQGQEANSPTLVVMQFCTISTQPVMIIDLRAPLSRSEALQ